MNKEDIKFPLFQLATRSIEPSFGLLFGDLLRDLEVGTTGAALIISCLDVMMNFSGLFVGPLLREFSYRKVAIAGALLCALGLALTSPAKSMAHILATYSVINGKSRVIFKHPLNHFCAPPWSLLGANLITCIHLVPTAPR